MSRSYKKNVYRKSRRFDRTCRCHGSCPYCRNNRLFFDKKKRVFWNADLKESSGM